MLSSCGYFLACVFSHLLYFICRCYVFFFNKGKSVSPVYRACSIDKLATVTLVDINSFPFIEPFSLKWWPSKTKSAASSKELTHSLKVSFRVKRQLFYLTAWKNKKWLNHQRGWAANRDHLPPAESKEIHPWWHLQHMGGGGVTSRNVFYILHSLISLTPTGELFPQYPGSNKDKPKSLLKFNSLIPFSHIIRPWDMFIYVIYDMFVMEVPGKFSLYQFLRQSLLTVTCV